MRLRYVFLFKVLSGEVSPDSQGFDADWPYVSLRSKPTGARSTPWTRRR